MLRIYANPHHVSLLVRALRDAAALLNHDLDVFTNYDSTSIILIDAPPSVRHLFYDYADSNPDEVTYESL